MGNTFIVGDVHGNYPKLKAALQAHGYKEDDDVIFVGDLMDRGYYNAKVARFIKRLGEKGHIIQGNHELQHQQLLPFYQAILGFGSPYPEMAAEIFKNYQPGVWWPETDVDCRCWQCSLQDVLQERKNVLSQPTTSFQEAVRQFVVYTIAWEDVRLWKLISILLKNMCGPPYDAEHTLYEYFAATQKTREAMEYIWNTNTKEINIAVKNSHYNNIVVTHNNPFGPFISSKDPKEGQNESHKNTLYVFGHIPVERVTLTQGFAGCNYLDIDLSPKNVGIYKITSN